MIILDCAQYSDAWHRARMGIPTASCFSHILTPAKGQPSKQADEYMDFLLSEWSLGRPLITKEFDWARRGKELEPDAVDRYDFEYAPTEQVGFVLRDDRLVGCSPDRFVGTDGILEIKSPKIENHMRVLRTHTVPVEHRCQIQGHLWLTERRWCDFCSYNPVLGLVVIRVERDEKFIEALAAAVNAFVAWLVEGRERLTKLGIDGAPRATNGHGARSYSGALEMAGLTDAEYQARL